MRLRALYIHIKPYFPRAGRPISINCPAPGHGNKSDYANISHAVYHREIRPEIARHGSRREQMIARRKKKRGERARGRAHGDRESENYFDRLVRTAVKRPPQFRHVFKRADDRSHIVIRVCYSENNNRGGVTRDMTYIQGG